MNIFSSFLTIELPFNLTFLAKFLEVELSIHCYYVHTFHLFLHPQQGGFSSPLPGETAPTKMTMDFTI